MLIYVTDQASYQSKKGQTGMSVLRFLRVANRSNRGVVFPAISHGTHLPRTDWRLVTGVEQQHHNCASLIGEAPTLTIAIVKREVRRRVADLGTGCFVHKLSYRNSGIGRG